MLFAPFQRKKRLQSLAMSRKLPTFALAFRKGGVNEIFERLRTRRKKTRQRRCIYSGQADVNSYRNNKRISRRAWPDRQKKRPRAALAPQARRAATIGRGADKKSKRDKFITVKSLILAQDER